MAPCVGYGTSCVDEAGDAVLYEHDDCVADGHIDAESRSLDAVYGQLAAFVDADVNYVVGSAKVPTSVSTPTTLASNSSGKRAASAYNQARRIIHLWTSGR